MKLSKSYALCVKNRGYVAALELRKVYAVLPDALARKKNLVRIIDESGESYLYPTSYFLPIAVPQSAARLFARKTA